MRDRFAAVERAAAGVAGVLIVAAALAARQAPEPWSVVGVAVLAVGSVVAVMAGPVVLRAWLAGRRPALTVGRAAAPPYPRLPVTKTGDVYADQPIYVPPPWPAPDLVDAAAAEAAAILQPDSPDLPPSDCSRCSCEDCAEVAACGGPAGCPCQARDEDIDRAYAVWVHAEQHRERLIREYREGRDA